VAVDNISDWFAAGADGAGLGSALYRPGRSAGDVGAIARAFVAAAREAKGWLSKLRPGLTPDCRLAAFPRWRVLRPRS
jgi:hypothetical protein